MKSEMTLERALGICQSINARLFLAEGLTDEPRLPTLENVSLGEMLAAARIVSERNAAEPSRDGHRTLIVVPCERLIAAVFVAVNYDARHTPIVVEPERGFGGAWKIKAVAVVDVTEQFELQDAKQVAA